MLHLAHSNSKQQQQAGWVVEWTAWERSEQWKSHTTTGVLNRVIQEKSTTAPTKALLINNHGFSGYEMSYNPILKLSIANIINYPYRHDFSLQEGAHSPQGLETISPGNAYRSYQSIVEYVFLWVHGTE